MRTRIHKTNYSKEAFAGTGPRVFNHTGYSTKLLRRWWVRACQRMGADPNGVVVKFTVAKRHGSSGWVRQTHQYTSGPATSWCVGRRKSMRFPQTWCLPTSAFVVVSNGAWANIVLPAPGYAQHRAKYSTTSGADHVALTTAMAVERTLLHEAHHVGEDQQDGFTFASRESGGTRGKWGDRPEEIRAVDATRLEHDDRENGRPEDDTMVLEFAEAMRARDLDAEFAKVWTCAKCGVPLQARGYRVTRSRKWNQALITRDVPRTAKESWCYDCVPGVAREVREAMDARAVAKAEVLDKAVSPPRKKTRRKAK